MPAPSRPATCRRSTRQRWRDAWNLKVFGYINLCRAVYPAMKARGGGVIVNVLGRRRRTADLGLHRRQRRQCLADGLHPRHGRHQPGRQDPHRRLQSRPHQHRAHGDDAARDRQGQARRCRALARADPQATRRSARPSNAPISWRFSRRTGPRTSPARSSRSTAGRRTSPGCCRRPPAPAAALRRGRSRQGDAAG